MNPILEYENPAQYEDFILANVAWIAQMEITEKSNRLIVQNGQLMLIPSKCKPIALPVGTTIIFRKYGKKR